MSCTPSRRRRGAASRPRSRSSTWSADASPPPSPFDAPVPAAGVVCGSAASACSWLRRLVRRLQHYDIEFDTDKSGERATAVRFTCRALPDSMMTHPGVCCRRPPADLRTQSGRHGALWNRHPRPIAQIASARRFRCESAIARKASGLFRWSSARTPASPERARSPPCTDRCSRRTSRASPSDDADGNCVAGRRVGITTTVVASSER